MPGRTFVSATGYRYGFNGKEKDDEVSGNGNQYDYGFRIYNPRLGRFLSVDPLSDDYPWYTPYQFAGNTPLWAIDIDGLEEAFATDRLDEHGNTIRTYTPNLKAKQEDRNIIQFKATGKTERLSDDNIYLKKVREIAKEGGVIYQRDSKGVLKRITGTYQIIQKQDNKIIEDKAQKNQPSSVKKAEDKIENPLKTDKPKDSGDTELDNSNKQAEKKDIKFIVIQPLVKGLQTKAKDELMDKMKADTKRALLSTGYDAVLFRETQYNADLPENTTMDLPKVYDKIIPAKK